jgi:glycine oxidase
MSEKKEILIVGAGLAGISAAWHLSKKNISFDIIDSGINHSSAIAAGLINPVVFRRMAKSWRIDEFLPYANAFYEEMTSELGKQYFHSIPIRRGFAHQQEYDLWIQKQDDPGYQDYLKKLDEEDIHFSDLKNICGTGKVLGAGYVSTKDFLADAKTWLLSKQCIEIEKFNYELLNAETGQYKSKTYNLILFCEGYQGLDNPWFNYLPLQATKGETLSIESSELNTAETLNRKCFILPIEGNKFKVGATYVWNDCTLNTTEEGKTELIKLLDLLISKNYTITEHQAGIRPTVLDRRPLIGKHPVFNKLVIFNGLGTKGYLMAPLLAKECVEYLIDDKILDKEIDIKRYQSKWNS